jgi:exopolysaccharide production protein ExoQ
MVYFIAPALFLRSARTKDKLFRCAYIGAAIFLIAMSRSRGAWISCGCLLAFAVIVTVGRRLNSRERVLMYWTLALGLIGAVVLTFAFLPSILQLLHKDSTLSGRTTIWNALFVSIGKHPLLGYGYSAFWLGLRGESANVISAIHWVALSYAENGLIELCLELGTVGVGLFVLAYFGAYRKLRKLLSYTNGTPELFWYASILFLLAVTNIESGEIAQPNSMVWVMFVIATSGIYKMHRQIFQPGASSDYGHSDQKDYIGGAMQAKAARATT